MTVRCENCGQTVQATDARCWHCGAALSGKPADGLRLDDQGTLMVPSPVEKQDISLTAVTLYAALTLITLLLIILLVRSLANRPLLLPNPHFTRPTGWQTLRNEAEQFILSLPADWVWQEGDTVVIPPDVNSVSTILQAAFPDLQLLGIAQAPKMAGFVLVTDSHGLQKMSAEDTAVFLTQHLPEETITAVEEKEGIDDTSVVSARLTLPGATGELTCQLQAVPAADQMFWLVGCAPVDTAVNVQPDLENVLLSFQPLPP
ncbi:MAG TPA: hypothetical protein EYH05_01515 [Anaerolineae bacterium]|nr:hypothetical protein [Anaerolineae bacterium]